MFLSVTVSLKFIFQTRQNPKTRHAKELFLFIYYHYYYKNNNKLNNKVVWHCAAWELTMREVRWFLHVNLFDSLCKPLISSPLSPSLSPSLSSITLPSLMFQDLRNQTHHNLSASRKIVSSWLLMLCITSCFLSPIFTLFLFQGLSSFLPSPFNPYKL